MSGYIKRWRSWSELDGCSYTARALYGEIVRLCDDRGLIACVNRDHFSAIGMRLGMSRGERRVLKDSITELESQGLLRLETGRVVVVAHEQIQRATRPTDVPFPTPPPAPFVSPSSAVRDQVTTTSVPVEHQNSHLWSPSEPNVRTKNDSSAGDDSNHAALYLTNQLTNQLKKRDPAPKTEPVPPPIPKELRALEDTFANPTLLEETRAAIGLTRRNGKVADSVWLQTLRKLSGVPPNHAIEAMRTFVDKHANGEKDERYLLGIASSLAKKRPVSQGSFAPLPHHEYADCGDPRELFGLPPIEPKPEAAQ